jgi:small conductance mechanosensitive channel
MQVESEPVSLLREALDWLLETTPGRAVIALAVLFVGWYCSRVAVRMLGRPVAQRFERQSLTQTILRMIRLSIMLVAIAIAAGIMGVGAGNILLSVTVLSAAVGIILAPIVGNYVSGLFVLADQPYEIGDMVEIIDADQTGLRGFIEDITLRYTKILSEDNTVLVVPNATIRERDVVNYSAEDERTRQSIDLTVSYEGDLAEARRIMVRSARAVDGVISGGPTIRIGSARYPARPTCNIVEYADHGVLLRLRYWLRTPYYNATIRSEIQRLIREEIEDANVDIPYPHVHHVFDETSGEARVVNGARDSNPAGPDLGDRR